MKVSLDASFMVSVIENKIDLIMELRKFGNPELVVLDLVVNELKRLSEGRGKVSRNARIALQFLGREMVDVLKAGEGNTDKKIAEYAEKRCITVCTIDKKLKTTLLKKKIQVITIRQNKYLVVAN